ncbi:Uncharacterised protein [uncultured archaeon]|nr:Uncharacterised protein [uncultured archaeon]
MIDKVTILITTFLRRGLLRRCLQGVATNLPECAVVVTSDDDIDPEFQGNERWRELPFDSGLTAKRNVGVQLVSTEYTLLGCDDFDFSTPDSRNGVCLLAEVLNNNPAVDVVCGRLLGRGNHAGFLEYIPGEYIRETRLNIGLTPPYSRAPVSVWKIDLGINFFLARTSVLREVPWDENIKPIGGEHGDFFLSLKEAGKTVVFLPSANIEEMTPLPGDVDERYAALRRRAQEGHEIFLKKRGIKRYISFGEKP